MYLYFFKICSRSLSSNLLKHDVDKLAWKFHQLNKWAALSNFGTKDTSLATHCIQKLAKDISVVTISMESPHAVYYKQERKHSIASILGILGSGNNLLENL